MRSGVQEVVVCATSLACQGITKSEIFWTGISNFQSPFTSSDHLTGLWSRWMALPHPPWTCRLKSVTCQCFFLSPKLNASMILSLTHLVNWWGAYADTHNMEHPYHRQGLQRVESCRGRSAACKVSNKEQTGYKAKNLRKEIFVYLKKRSANASLQIIALDPACTKTTFRKPLCSSAWPLLSLEICG